MAQFDKFLSKAKEAREAVAKMKDLLVVNHYDCDGISAGSIVCKFCEREGIKYRVKTIRKLDKHVLDELKEEKEIVFTDLGGGNKQVNELNGNVVIFDHHQTEGIEKLQLNPHLFGIDGGTDMSGSTCVYWALEQLPEVAIVGAIGDMQYPMQGENRKLVEKFVEKGWVEAPIDLKFYGRMSRPLPQLLAYADDPYLPGLGGSEERCAKFLENLELGSKEGKWRKYNELEKGEKEKLVGAVAAHLAETYGGKYNANNLVGETYLFPKFKDVPELYDGGEFSTMLNACGRHGKTEVGMDICLGKEGAIEKGRKLLEMHKRALREGVEFAYKNTKDLGQILLLDGRGVIEDSIIGVVAGMLFPGGRKKPILAMALDKKGKIKISGRGTKKLIEKGLNLGLALREACLKTGGQGGGHKIAAGATVPPERLDEFLKLFAKIVEKQIQD
ncbi:MAG: DHH family phosphoesterase [Candidatus Micrarchaeota archaeon]